MESLQQHILPANGTLRRSAEVILGYSLKRHFDGWLPMFQMISRLAAWGAVVAIGVLTLGPIEWRPHTGVPGHLEHVAAYLLAATLFSVAYPRRALIVIIALFLIYAASLEIAQHYVPGRHASVSDWVAKSIGVLIGVVVGPFILRLWLRSLDNRNSSAA